MPNIFDILGIPRAIPSIDPTTGLPVDGPIVSDPTGALGISPPAPSMTFDEAFAPYQMDASNNALANILGGGFNPQAAGPPENLLEGTPYDPAMQQPAAPAAAPSRAPRDRKSLLDIIGGVADTVASVGGATPLYRTNLDAAAERQRQVDLDEMRKQQFEQQQRLGEQQLQVGDIGIANDERSRIGGALASVIGSDNPAAVFGAVAGQSGISPEKAAAISAALQSGVDPARLAQSFGYAPQAQGSLPKEVQIYRMLQAENPELAPAYLQSLTNPNAMNEYQAGQLQLGLARLGLQQDQFEESQRQFDVKQAGGGEGADLTPTQRGNVRQKLQQLPVISQQLARVKELAQQMEQEGTSARGKVLGLIPGQIAGGTAEEFDKALALLTSQMRQLTRTPGEGSMSDYESRLAAATVPSRWGSDQGRAESIRNIEVLLGGLQSGYTDMLGTPAPAPAPRSRGSSSRQPAPRSAVAPPAVGTVRRGYRFKGGDPASPSSWEKVN